AFALMGVQAVKGVEIGDGFALAALRGSQAHDEIRTDRRRDTNRAGGIEAGVSNGEEIVVRAAMKPLPTLMKPLASVDLATGEEATALVEGAAVAGVGARASSRRTGCSKGACSCGWASSSRSAARPSSASRRPRSSATHWRPAIPLSSIWAAGP